MAQIDKNQWINRALKNLRYKWVREDEPFNPNEACYDGAYRDYSYRPKKESFLIRSLKNLLSKIVYLCCIPLSFFLLLSCLAAITKLELLIWPHIPNSFAIKPHLTLTLGVTMLGGFYLGRCNWLILAHYLHETICRLMI